MDFVNIFVYFVLPAVVLGYFYLKKKYSYFEERGIPFVPANSWLLGSFGEVRSKFHLADFMVQAYEATKGKDVIAGYFSVFSPTILVTDLEMIKNVTIKDWNYFSGRGLYVNEETDKISGHLLALEGERWRFLRNKLSPVFTSGKIKSMYETIADKGESLVSAIELASKSGSVEMKDMANRFTVDVISSCAFGMESNTLGKEHPEFMQFFTDIYDADGVMMMKSLVLSVLPKLSKALNLRLFREKTENFIHEIVGGTMKYREQNEVVRNDFLNMLMQLKNKGSIDGEISSDTRKLSYDECIAQA
jgi:cytochrome P450 family 6